MVTMSDKGPVDKDVRGMGTGWILSTGAAGMDITPGEVRYPGAYRADDMHVPYHGAQDAGGYTVSGLYRRAR